MVDRVESEQRHVTKPEEPAGEREWIAFLQWAMPRRQFRWRGFRNVRGQVEKRIARRMKQLGLRSLGAYRSYLDEHPQEWSAIDASCHITISRFYRDRGVFDALERELLPALAARALGEDGVIRCWSAGCASGEEPYTLAILWKLRVQPAFPSVHLRIIATDVDAEVLERARVARYPAAALRELPPALTSVAFFRSGDDYVLEPELRAEVELRLQDIRGGQPSEHFHLVLCRNLAFTYFDVPLQREILEGIRQRTLPGGFLVIGRHEALPPGATGWMPLRASKIYRRAES